MSAITSQEFADLARLEATIQAGRNTFVSVGIAVGEIRERRLYRKDYDTFEDYCQVRWGWNAQRSRQLINAAAVVQALPVGTMVPTERAARELGRVPEPERAAVVDRALATGKTVTAKAIQTAAIEIAAKVEPDVVRDSEGYPVPEGLVQFFTRIPEIESLLKSLSGVIAVLKKASESDDRIFGEVNTTGLASDLRKISYSIGRAAPFSVCYQCQGHPEVAPCMMCKGRGFLSKHLLATVPEEMRKLRQKGMKK
jgi:hypothetical protein